MSFDNSSYYPSDSSTRGSFSLPSPRYSASEEESSRSSSRYALPPPAYSVDTPQSSRRTSYATVDSTGQQVVPYNNNHQASLGDFSHSTSNMSQMPVGPSNWVDPVTYRNIKHGRSGKRKRKTKSKSRRRKTSAPGYAVYHPTGDIAGVIGRGGYFSDALSAVGRAAKRMVPVGAFSRLGTAAGGALGGGPGAALGGLAGHAISQIAGFGAYNVKANSLMAQIDEGVQIPQFSNAQHATIVKHREYVMDITAVGATAFTNISLALNPGLPTTFPWLAGVASNYDQYQILGMIWEFRTLSSDITAGGALGSVVLASDYDVVDSAYSSKLLMENSEYCTSNKPSVDTVHCIECDPSITFSPIKFIRDAAVPSGKDPRLYDHANFQIATVGLPTSGTVVLGELWCSYEIALYKPNLEQSLSTSSAMDHFSLPTTISASHYMASAANVTTAANTGSQIGGTVTTSTYTFPPSLATGNYYLVYNCAGASSTITTSFQFGTLVNCSQINFIVNDTTGNVPFPASATVAQTNAGVLFALKITAAGATATISQGTVPGTCTGGDLWVISLPPGLVT